jgi:predicted Zn-dependent peptidase
MYRQISLLITIGFLILDARAIGSRQPLAQLSGLKQQQEIGGFRVANLYDDTTGIIVGAKYYHIRTAAPVFLLQIETVPKAFFWVDTPDHSDRGVPHALEHLLAGKGTKGRYVTLLTDMRLSESAAATYQDFNFYSFSSGTGIDGFFEELHAWLDALFHADFTDTEAKRELYHFGISADAAKKFTLVEGGSVYDEDQTGQSTETYYFELNKRLLGSQNPFSADIRGLPDPMREVTSQDIRQFYEEHYRLGPTTGFVFIIDPKESVPDFLERVSREFDGFAQPDVTSTAAKPADEPKYPIHSSEDTSIGIYSFPSGRETDAAAVRIGWKPVKTESSVELKLLQLFFRGLAADQDSVLYKALVDSRTRELDSGATRVDYDVFLQNSPFFPFEQIEISGIPGDRISGEQTERLRSLILGKIRKISQYEDESTDLRLFNELIVSYAKAWRRSESVWIKTPPLFGSDLSAEWKAHFRILEMDPAFVRSLSEEPAWQAVEHQLKSGKNIWRDLIPKFHLLDTPYAMASKPSPQLLQGIEKAKQDRIQRKIDALRLQYKRTDDQDALAQFDRDELSKTREIDAIEARVSRPRFTDHPPLTADDEIRYRQFRLGDVPVIASLFERPPTLDIGLAFDLRQIPRKYYKYLPILPRSFDSLGLRLNRQIVPYPELRAQLQEKTLSFTVGYEEDAFSKRADLVFRASTSTPQEFRTALDLVSKVLHFANCNVSMTDRLRDLVAQRLAVDQEFGRDEFKMLQNAAYSFLTQQDTLFQAVFAAFPRTHWDERLEWKLHQPVSATEIEQLGTFAMKTYSNLTGVPAEQILHELERSDLSPLQRELLEYWQRGLATLPDNQVDKGLQQLTFEVQQDLRTGPAQAIAEMRELQEIVVNRKALHIDLVGDETTLGTIRADLLHFIDSIAVVSRRKATNPESSMTFPIMSKVAERYQLPRPDFPWHVGLVTPGATNGDMVFYADLPGYSNLDRASLVKVLSSKILAGYGPESFFIKTREAGLAYAILLTSNPAYKLVWDYADRSPDLPGLVTLLNTVAHKVSSFNDPRIVDYALRQTFSIPRSIYPPSTRGIAMAQDLRDGNDPDRVRRFSEAILKLRQDPHLFSELTRTGMSSICAILLEPQCKESQKALHSIFFFVGSEKILSDTEKRLPIPKLLRLWPSDYWLQ